MSSTGRGSGELASRECVPCRGGVPPLAGPELATLLNQLGNGWQVIDGHHLEKEFKFRNFREALDFANRVGELAERVNHHPDLLVAWGRVKVTVFTHKIKGLSETDFVFAAKTDAV
jgi:4a-hydroxytetrahydrobiopterin dehydratase